jgi:hypothetical protein
MSLRFEHFPYVLARYTTLEKDSVTLLLQEWPGAISELDSNGRTVLHCAFDGPPTPGYRVAPPLLKKWSGAGHVPGGRGFLRLHVAASADVPLDVLYSMLRLQSGVLRGQEGSGEPPQTPPNTTTTHRSGTRPSKKARTVDSLVETTEY